MNYLLPSAWTMKQSFIKYLLLSASFHLSLQENKPCVQRDFGHSSFVCVCNSTYCDTYDKIEGTSFSVQKTKKKPNELFQQHLNWWDGFQIEEAKGFRDILCLGNPIMRRSE